MSYDLYISQRKLALAEGLADADLSFRINNAGMHLLIDLLAEAGVVDDDAEVPSFPGSADRDDPLAFMHPDPAMLRWEAEQRSRLELVDESEVNVPGVKFSTNDYWLVFPAEARVMARALRSVDDDLVRRVLEADEDEMRAINDPAVDDPPDLPTAIANIRKTAQVFADFCERAGQYGGFRVG